MPVLRRVRLVERNQVYAQPTLKERELVPRGSVFPVGDFRGRGGGSEAGLEAV